jgi:hypothetical protein
MFSEERGVGSAAWPRERASGRRKAAHFLPECTERRTNPREANHSEQLARGGADGGLFRRELKSGSPWVLALGHAARSTPVHGPSQHPGPGAYCGLLLSCTGSIAGNQTCKC